MIHKRKNCAEVAEIQCNAEPVGFIFEHVRFLKLQSINISHCGRKIPANLFNCSEELHPCQAAVALKDVYSLTMLSVSVLANNGYGVVAEGLYGNSIIEKCSFVNNTGQTEGFVGGNFFIKYEQCPVEYTREQINMLIASSEFLGGYAAYPVQGKSSKYPLKAKATGISLIVSCTNTSIRLLDVDLDYNKAFSYSSKGGNLFILFGKHYMLYKQ